MDEKLTASERTAVSWFAWQQGRRWRLVLEQQARAPDRGGARTPARVSWRRCGRSVAGASPGCAGCTSGPRPEPNP